MIALAVSMYDEVECMVKNLDRWGSAFSHIELVQSGVDPYPAIEERLRSHPKGIYTRFPNLDTRKNQDAKAERLDVGARSMARNFSCGFKGISQNNNISYAVGITGDTEFVHLDGINRIIGRMGDSDIAVSRAMGQNFHASHWTEKDMLNPNHRCEGRFQDQSNGDFMPQLFIAKAEIVSKLSNVEVTNRWCFEQCLGDSVLGTKKYVFSPTAYGFNDGIRYHHPSPKGWSHT